MNNLIFENLTLEQKLGIVLCARKWDTRSDVDFALELIKNRALGCVQIPFNENTPYLIKKIKEVADYPIIIVNDMERGYPLSDVPKMSALTLAACANEEHYKAFAKSIVAFAKADGFNGTWGPNVDILHFNTTRVVKLDPTNAEDVTRAEIIAREQVFEMYNFLRDNFEEFKDSTLISTGIQIGVRESRMIDGLHLLTEEELKTLYKAAKSKGKSK